MRILLILGAALGLFLVCGVVYFLSGFGDDYVLFYTILGFSLLLFLNFVSPTIRNVVARIMSGLINSKIALIIFLAIAFAGVIFTLPYLSNLSV